MEIYSSESAEKTIKWMSAIAEFLCQFRHLLDAHVTNFFKDRLWEMVDEEWMECLRKGPVENFVGIPSGLIKEHWPGTLKDFVEKLKSLALPRDPKSSVTIFHDFHVEQLGSVLSQGMNQKKKHEVEILSAAVSALASSVGAATIIDVGSGQGYLAQVLSFMYHLSVIALDASPHHASVTSSRAERIKKHFNAQHRKSQNKSKFLNGPRTIIQEIVSSNSLTEILENINDNSSSNNELEGSPLVLAGLHACGDLSVNMLRTFIECEHVKAIACISCCYNLLSEEGSAKSNSCCFPISKGGKSLGLSLGRNARDLGCQSEERWRSSTQDAAIHNFQLHAFRAAFQLILGKYYSSAPGSHPAIGRQGKTLRQRHLRRALNSQLNEEKIHKFLVNGTCSDADTDSAVRGTISGYTLMDEQPAAVDVATDHDANPSVRDSEGDCRNGHLFSEFEEFSKAGLARLNYGNPDDIDFLETWQEVQPHIDLIGPYWALRAALGPLVETYVLLDRLLFLQEQGQEMKVNMVPLFDPLLSPRNVAIIAVKK